MTKELIYGVADRAWQVVVGCEPAMPCAARCWARRTTARIVECQGEGVREIFQIALTPDKTQWSGKVLLDEARLLDPLKWKTPALIATGFHGDWGRLPMTDMERIISVIIQSQHRFLMLSKAVETVERYLRCSGVRRLFRAGSSDMSIGCSVMYQRGEFGADAMREPMKRIANLGWNTHVWYEPALGPVNWEGWEFLRGMIAGGESGKDSRPSHPQWYRDTRDWCVKNGIPFNFKQWGDWGPRGSFTGSQVYRTSKKHQGRTLDGRTWDEVPAFL